MLGFRQVPRGMFSLGKLSIHSRKLTRNIDAFSMISYVLQRKHMLVV